VSSGLGLEHFEGVLSKAAWHGHGAFSVVRRDGVLLARSPRVENKIGSMLADRNFQNVVSAADHGAVHQRSAVDGQDRFFVAQSLASYPLLAVASATEAEVLAAWRAEAAVIGGLAVLLDLLIAAGIWPAVRSLKTKLLRQRAEASEDRFRLLVEHAPDGVVLYDADRHVFLDANPQAEVLFGLPRAEIIKRGPQDLYAPAQPDRQPIQQTVAQNDDRALAGEQLRA
jgi:PAS domain-containing protein